MGGKPISKELYPSRDYLQWRLAQAEDDDYEEGEEIDFNRVFSVQNTKTQQEVAAAAAKGDVAQSVVAIYRALGGGWPSPYLTQPIGPLSESEDDPNRAEEIDAPPANEQLPIDAILENPMDGAIDQ